MAQLSLSTHNEQSWLHRLTIADGLFLLVGVAAILLRFVNLGRLLLSPAEAEAALGVWRFWQPGGLVGDATAVTVQSPVYFTLTALLSQLFGFGDGVMRAVPALFGVGLALLPWLLRHRLGNVGALVTSWLLTISPLTTIAARTANGDAAALFAVLLLLTAWVRYTDSDNPRWLYALAGALALGLTSSPIFYGGLLALLLAHWLNRALRGGHAEGQINKETGWKTAVFGFTLLLALGTLFLWHLPALGAAAGLLGQWLQAFTFSGGLAALSNPFLALARYEVALLVLGLLALLWAAWHDDRLANIAILWLAALLTLLLVQWGHMSNTLLLLLPGYLLIGRLVDTVLDDLGDGLTWLFTAGLAVLGGLMFVNVARFARVVSYNPQDLQNIWLALFAFSFTAVTVYFFWAWAQKPTYQAMLLSALLLFSFYHWGTGWWLSHEAANDLRERWVQAPATDDDLPIMLHTLREISAQATGYPTGVEIVSGIDTPVLRWYLRGFPNATISNTVPATAQADVIITAQNGESGFGADYFGADYGLLRTGLVPESLNSPLPTLDTLRWWLFHESGAIVEETRVVLWIRADLVQP